MWPVVAARRAGVDLQSFAFAGQCQLDPFVARMIGQQPADLISLKLGINIVNADSMRERTFVPAVHGFLDTGPRPSPGRARSSSSPRSPARWPRTTPVRPGSTSTGSAPSSTDPPHLALGALTLRRVRELEADIVAVAPGGRRPRTSICSRARDLFGPDDVGDLPDGLHPNAAGYQRIGERFHALAFEGDGPFAP